MLRYLEGVVTLQLADEACIGCGVCQTVCPHGVFAVEDGKRLWDGSASVGYNSPPDMFVIDDSLWTKGKQVQRIALGNNDSLIGR